MKKIKTILITLFIAGTINLLGQEVRHNNWIHKLGGSGNQVYPSNIASDANGNIYVTGYFYCFNGNKFDLNPGTDTLNFSNNSNGDIFIAKFTKNGNLIWGKAIGGSNFDACNSIYVKNNFLYMTGRFRGTVDFDPNYGVTNLISNNNSDDAFILKLDTSGNYVWANSIGSVNFDEGKKIIINTVNDNITLCGSFNNTCDFDPSNSVANLTSNGGGDAFIANYNQSGVYVSAYSFGAGSFDVANSIEYDANGGLIVVGNFYGSVDFDVTSSQSILTANYIDGFIAYYNPDYTLKFVKKIGGNKTDEIYDVKLDPQGNIYVGGIFRDTCIFDSSDKKWESIAVGSNDAFIYILSSQNGNPIDLNILNAEPTKYVYINRLALSSQGSIYGAGESNSSITVNKNNEIYNLKVIGSNGFIVGIDKFKEFINIENFSNKSGFGGINDFTINSNKEIFMIGGFSSTPDFEPSERIKNIVGSGINVFIGHYTTCERVKINASFYNNIIGDTACKGSITLIKPNVIPSGTTISWYAKDTGKTYLSGANFITQKMTSNTTYYLQDSMCSVTNRKPVNIYVVEIDSTVDKNGPKLTASATSSSLKYQWINCDNQTNITGATSNSFTPNNSGNYAVIITDTITQCSVKSNCTYVVSNNKIMSNSNKIKLYPNPANQSIQIETTNNQSAIMFEIFDVTGKTIKTGKINSVNSTINIEDLNEGIYYIQFNHTNETIKFVKMN